MSKQYELIRKIGVLGEYASGTSKEINIVKWGNCAPMLDIRRWKNGEPTKGISLGKTEAFRLLELLKNEGEALSGDAYVTAS